MRFLVLLLCVVGLLGSGCRKKSSREYYKLEADQSILVSQDGDDAWVSPEMTAIVSGLQAIPEDTLEKPKAVALLATIAAEQARVTAERVEPPKGPAVDPFEGRVGSTGTATATAVVEPLPEPPETANDAGVMPDPTQPWARMDEKFFVARFGKCFSPGPSMPTSAGGMATSQVLSSTAECQKRFGSAGAVTSFLFTDKGLTEKITESTVVLDGGSVTIPGRQPPTPDPGPPVLTIPGAPALEAPDAG